MRAAAVAKTAIESGNQVATKSSQVREAPACSTPTARTASSRPQLCGLSLCGHPCPNHLEKGLSRFVDHLLGDQAVASEVEELLGLGRINHYRPRARTRTRRFLVGQVGRMFSAFVELDRWPSDTTNKRDHCVVRKALK